MIKLKPLRKPVSMGLSLLLAFSLAIPVSAQHSNSSTIDMKSGLAEVTTSKVNAKLTKEFEGSEYVTYLVKMKEQVDTAAVSKQAMEKATIAKETPSATKLSVRNSVVSSLRETASRTQYAIEHYLEKEIDLGKVKEYKSYFIVNSLAVTSTKEVMEQIASLPEVEKILPNETRYLQKAEPSKQSATLPPAKDATQSPAKEPAVNEPSTKGSASQGSAASTKEADSNVKKQTENVEWNIDYINAPAVWERGIDGTGIVVANLDSGVDYTHPALRSKWRGLDASGNVADPELSWYDPHSGAALPADEDGHGTHTMGTMVGSEADGSNQIGVAPGAKWIGVRIFNPETTDAIILDGGQWLIAPVDAEGNLHPELAPDVVNNSWGGGAGLDEWFRPMVQAWRDAQIFPEFSAGNVRLTNPGGPGSVANPANYPESFATGATDINGNLASFSLLGPSPYDEIKPEVSAPGVNIRSAVPGGTYEGGWNGTSMAGPHTTALAALLLQANHSLNVDQLEQIIMDTATPRTDSQYPVSPNNGYGHGIINALDAVGSVLEGVGTV
ncbi:MAG: S8 family serine peptidase, partial [Paenibacillus sp.]|uniref:S8 family serine peptidase n=1 Tax=Paenibacillus sp. TaxID=58172 RepID=UPI0025D6EFA1